MTAVMCLIHSIILFLVYQTYFNYPRLVMAMYKSFQDGSMLGCSTDGSICQPDYLIDLNASYYLICSPLHATLHLFYIEKVSSNRKKLEFPFEIVGSDGF